MATQDDVFNLSESEAGSYLAGKQKTNGLVVNHCSQEYILNMGFSCITKINKISIIIFLNSFITK